MGIFDSLFGGKKSSNSCKRCGKYIISSSEYYTKCEEAGLPVERSSGGVSLGGLLSTRGKELTDQIGFKCLSCGLVYCHGCLLFNAPGHQSGGKACPSCGGSFRVCP